MARTTSMKGDIYITGVIRLPPEFDATQRYSALGCAHPGSSVKKQTADIYAEKMSREDNVILAFDTSYQGESGSESRYLEYPAKRVEDIRCAVDHLVTSVIDVNRLSIAEGIHWTSPNPANASGKRDWSIVADYIIRPEVGQG